MGGKKSIESFTEEDTRKAVYEMKLHDVITIDFDPLVTIRRVPGGWIYTESQENERCDTNALTATFVPLNNEFVVDTGLEKVDL